jgi:hypothetical protein
MLHRSQKKLNAIFCPAWTPDSVTSLSSIIDSVVDRFGPPQRIGVIELEEIDPSPWILVAAGIHLLVTVPSVHRHYLIQQRLAGILFGFLFTGDVFCEKEQTPVKEQIQENCLYIKQLKLLSFFDKLFIKNSLDPLSNL